MAAANAQLVDGTAQHVRGFGAMEELTLNVNSVNVVTQADLDAARNWRITAYAAGVYAMQGKPAELTAGTGRTAYCPPNTTIILRAVLGEGVKVN